MFKTLYGPVEAKAIQHLESPLENRGASLRSLTIITLAGCLGYMGVLPEGILVLMMSAVVICETVKRMDQGLPLMQVAALLAVVQWLVGPWLTYYVDLEYLVYFMRVDSATYFAYAFPGTAAYVLGLLAVGVSPRQKILFRKVDSSRFMECGLILAAIAFAAELGRGFVSGGLGFVFFLLSQLRYVAALYFIFSNRPLRWVCAGVLVLPLFTVSSETGLFHDLLLWMGILICYWYALKKRALWVTSLLLIFGFTAIFTIQGVKISHRNKVWNQESGVLTKEIVDFWSNPKEMLSRETLSNAVIRINQGWIISAILQNVPSSEPYAKGDTIGDAVYASLVPRILAKDKTLAGGQVNFRRFTGLPLADTTSMGLSLIGESYANAGPEVGILLMLLFGGLMSLSFGFCLAWSVKHPTFYFWIPVIFCQTIKAETDLVTVLNHITKGSLVCFGLYWLASRNFLVFKHVAHDIKGTADN
jgi:hypothetical protein